MCNCRAEVIRTEIEYNIGYPDSEENIIHCICSCCEAEWVE